MHLLISHEHHTTIILNAHPFVKISCNAASSINTCTVKKNNQEKWIITSKWHFFFILLFIGLDYIPLMRERYGSSANKIQNPNAASTWYQISISWAYLPIASKSSYLPIVDGSTYYHIIYVRIQVMATIYHMHIYTWVTMITVTIHTYVPMFTEPAVPTIAMGARPLFLSVSTFSARSPSPSNFTTQLEPCPIISSAELG